MQPKPAKTLKTRRQTCCLSPIVLPLILVVVAVAVGASHVALGACLLIINTFN